MSIRRGLNLTALVCVVLVLLRLSSAADDDHGVELEGYEEVLTADDIRVIVDKHNALRSSEKASNMNYLVSRRHYLIRPILCYLTWSGYV